MLDSAALLTFLTAGKALIRVEIERQGLCFGQLGKFHTGGRRTCVAERGGDWTPIPSRLASNLLQNFSFGPYEIWASVAGSSEQISCLARITTF